MFVNLNQCHWELEQIIFQFKQQNVFQESRQAILWISKKLGSLRLKTNWYWNHQTGKHNQTFCFISEWRPRNYHNSIAVSCALNVLKKLQFGQTKRILTFLDKKTNIIYQKTRVNYQCAMGLWNYFILYSVWLFLFIVRILCYIHDRASTKTVIPCVYVNVIYLFMTLLERWKQLRMWHVILKSRKV